jgi:23S rRNA pseudouridine1911/1915/1917 synthase
MPPDARKLMPRFRRQALHAYQLGFSHPETGKAMLFESPLPTDISRLLDALKSA